MEKADRASIHALEPKKPGKKPKTHQAVEMEELTTLTRGEKLPGEEGHSGKKTETRSRRKREKR
jgi:hypothetical protein